MEEGKNIKNKKRKAKNTNKETSEPCPGPAKKQKMEMVEVSNNKEVMSSIPFEKLKGVISEKTLKAIREMELTHMTNIQSKVLPPAMKNRDLIGNAKTGSGKTLAFLIPVIERLVQLNFKPTTGTGAIIISPTRELAMQIYDNLLKLLKYHNQTAGIVMGKTNIKAEGRRLREGINILVATPGRLLDHMCRTKHFDYTDLRCLVIDEADRLLDSGFEVTMTDIIRNLPSRRRQTLLFSATENEKTSALAALALKDPVHIKLGIDEPTVSGLNQFYDICPVDQRLWYLIWVMRNLKSGWKGMIFFSSCESVEYHHLIFRVYEYPVLALHGKMAQGARTATFNEFKTRSSVTLLCTDVAARGLDFPKVDWVVQFDPPKDAKQYIHRVGRTARGEGSKGKALMFLLEHEKPFLRHLREANINLVRLDWEEKDVIMSQENLENNTDELKHLKKLAKKAMQAYLRSYMTHQLRDAFDVTKIDLDALAKSFGLRKKPSEVYLDISAKTLRKAKKAAILYK